MWRIRTYNSISAVGLERLPRDKYEVASMLSDPDGIIARSAKLHDLEFSPRLKAIARAGAGYNNIPVERCSENGIVVFNTPGANANSVKELVLAALFVSSREIISGVNWARGLGQHAEGVGKQVEKGKSRFSGPEIQGKTLGVIGLGAIGVLVANAAQSLGMRVIGYDPFISIEAAWGLSKSVERAQGLESMMGSVDYLTLHVPLNDKTRAMINDEKLSYLKPGARILNFARGELVDHGALIRNLEKGRVHRYVTDFPSEELISRDDVICVPHLGASTPEALDNCAIMAAMQLRDYFENGNIKNSVNFPTCEMPRIKGSRILVTNLNIPAMVGQITTVLAEERANIEDMLNRHKGDLAYNIVDVGNGVAPDLIERLRAIRGVIGVRILPPSVID